MEHNSCKPKSHPDKQNVISCINSVHTPTRVRTHVHTQTNTQTHTHTHAHTNTHTCTDSWIILLDLNTVSKLYQYHGFSTYRVGLREVGVGGKSQARGLTLYHTLEQKVAIGCVLIKAQSKQPWCTRQAEMVVDSNFTQL